MFQQVIGKRSERIKNTKEIPGMYTHIWNFLFCEKTGLMKRKKNIQGDGFTLEHVLFT